MLTREEKLEATLRAILAASPNTKVKKFYSMIYAAMESGPRTWWPCECRTWNSISNDKCRNCGKDR